MNVVGYTRVSTDEQAKEGVSLAAQAQKILAYTLMNQLALAQIIEDAGHSAKSLARPGLQRLLTLVDAGQVHILIVTKLDRLTRSVSDQDYLTRRFDKRQVTLVSLQERVNPATATGEFMLNILASINQWERKMIGERTRDAMQHLKATGQVYSRPVCTDAQLIAWMQGQRAAGHSYRDIASTLTAEGVPSIRGGQWAAPTVMRILRRHQTDGRPSRYQGTP